MRCSIFVKTLKQHLHAVQQRWLAQQPSPGHDGHLSKVNFNNFVSSLTRQPIKLYEHSNNDFDWLILAYFIREQSTNLENYVWVENSAGCVGKLMDSLFLRALPLPGCFTTEQITVKASCSRKVCLAGYMFSMWEFDTDNHLVTGA